MEIDRETTLADLASLGGRTQAVLEGFGLDYCCSGGRSLGDACTQADLELDLVIAALSDLPATPAPEWLRLSPAELAEDIVATHHAYLHRELGRLTALLAKVESVHGAAHHELAHVSRAYAELRGDLEPHLVKEEQVLFPMIHRLAEARAGDEPPPHLHCGSIANPITVMRAEHDRAGELLAQLHDLTNGFSPPSDACASFRALYLGLANLDADTRLHVHKENNVLFPAVERLAANP